MCWMTAKYGDDAAQRAVEAIRRHEASNGHSWGVAAVVDGELTIDKGVGEVPDDYEPPESECAVAHTRFATRGTISEANAHPFGIEKDGEVVAALAHNGTWREAPNHPDKCDSRFIAEAIEDVAQDLGLELAVQAVGAKVGETFLVIARDGVVYCHSGRYDITWERDEGSIASSGFEERIPPGTVVKMS